MIGQNRHIKPIPARLAAMVPRPTGKTEKIGRNMDLPDTMALISRKINAESWQTRALALEIAKGKTPREACRALHGFILGHIAYEEDASGTEQVRSPARLVADAKGDCDCYSVFLGCCLKELGIPFFLRLSWNYAGREKPNHIYAVAVLEGRQTVMDPVAGAFEAEANYFKKQDFDPLKNLYMDLHALNGLDELGKLRLLKKKDGSATGFSKVLNVANKINPLAMALRGGLNLALRANLMNVAGRLRWAYANRESAIAAGLDATALDKISKALAHLETAWNAGGGNKSNLKEAILESKGNADKAVLGALPGAGEIVMISKISAMLDEALAPAGQALLAAFENNAGNVARRLSLVWSGVPELAPALEYAAKNANAYYGISRERLEAAIKTGAASGGLGSIATFTAAVTAFIAKVADMMKGIDADGMIAKFKAKKKAAADAKAEAEAAALAAEQAAAAAAQAAADAEAKAGADAQAQADAAAQAAADAQAQTGKSGGLTVIENGGGSIQTQNDPAQNLPAEGNQNAGGSPPAKKTLIEEHGNKILLGAVLLGVGYMAFGKKESGKTLSGAPKMSKEGFKRKMAAGKRKAARERESGKTNGKTIKTIRI